VLGFTELPPSFPNQSLNIRPNSSLRLRAEAAFAVESGAQFAGAYITTATA
jgi:hypothetical protein